MDFKKAGLLGLYISKDYAEDMFRLLSTYKDISASEAASRLNMHIKTVQDFLEAMTSLDILDRKETLEGKRPYFRYTLKTNSINMSIDLTELTYESTTEGENEIRIREATNAKAKFNTARNNQYISSINIWIGEGRMRTERKLNLSIPQGKFLYHLPFPGASYLGVHEIMKNAGVDETHISEILDIVSVLQGFGVIDSL